MPGSKRRRHDDVWQLIVTMGSDYSGKPIRYTRTVHCKNEKEADKELARFYVECEDGRQNKAETMTVSAFYDLFRNNYCRIKVKDSTQQRYDVHMRNQIGPYLGKRKMDSIKKYEIQQWINDLSSSGLSPKTVKNTWSLIHTMFEVAITWDIVKSNPCEHIELPRNAKKEADYYSLDEVKMVLTRLMDDIDKDPLYGTVLVLELFSGMRLSELAGLKWSDLDYEGNKVNVERQRQHLSDYGTYESTPKTDKGIRTISIPSFVMDMLKKLELKYKELAILQGIPWSDNYYVISNEDLTPKNPRAVAVWWRSYDVPGLRKITFHQLRHTHTAILAHIGIDKYDISDRLGHANFSTTLRTYMHILEPKDDDVADRLGSFVAQLLPGR